MYASGWLMACLGGCLSFERVVELELAKSKDEEQMRMMSGNCICCYSSFFWIAVVVLLIILQVLHLLFSFLSHQFHVIEYYQRFLRIFQFLSVILVGFFAIFANSSSLQNYGFSKIAKVILLKDQPLDHDRCEHFQNLCGRILEIGPGPGTNFRCWKNSSSSAITEWVGVEPNHYFQELLFEEKNKQNITFPTRTVWLKGENVDVEPNSFDYVVGSHVLCSVDNVEQVIQQIKRALKPGGTYYFLEHVAADKDSNEYIWQQMLQPLITIIGAGCKFKELWNDFNEKTLFSGYDVQFTRKSLPMGISFFSPHIIGTARKPF